MLFNLRAIVVAGAAVLLALPAEAKPPLEAFGDVPAVRAADLSPDGKKMVFINRLDGKDYLTVYDFDTGESVPLASTTEIRARYASFAGDDHVLLIASDQMRMEHFIGAHETSVAFSYNLKTKKLVQLLQNTDGVYPGQAAHGNIIAVDPDGKHVYMPILMGQIGNKPSYDVLKVDLDTGRSVRGSTLFGEKNTVGWTVTKAGKPIAREDYDDKTQVLSIHLYENGKPREIFREKQELITTGVTGVTSDGDLIVYADDDMDRQGIFAMSRVDGSLKSLARRADADVESTILNPEDKTLRGVVYGGMFASYDMADPALDADVDAVVGAVPGAAVSIQSASDDWTKLLLMVHGGTRAERYMLFDRTSKKLSLVSYLRPDIKPEDVGEVTTIEYKARDGLTIPALLTWPAGVPKDQRKNLPLVVMPHGGPASYDSVGFDWLAQFVANEGYLVIQPNFRGSEGFGKAFRDAGHKQWGRKMQDDVTDGAKALFEMGWADPNRTCIVGWSYGGYSALAGGALTPDLYKCVASIAGVSDLRTMLAKSRNLGGKKSMAYTYWSDVIGDLDTDGAAIDAVSPVRLADKFKAPVLLVHGSEDNVVEISQSERMESALKGAGKDVLFIRMTGDDHGLVDNDSRRQMLKVLGEFLAKHIGK